jgi:ubiquinone/menaquinone biosynthesis C-methylase UbiE
MPKPGAVLQEMARVAKPRARLVIIDSLAPESAPKFELHNQIERLRDPCQADTPRLRSFLAIFEECGFEVVRQTIRRRSRSFNQWMARAGLESAQKRYQEVRRLLDSIPGDRAGLSPEIQGDDVAIGTTKECSF